MKINELIEFPTSFNIKIIGINSSTLIDSVLDNIRTIIPEFYTQPKIKLSNKGNYISLTVEVFVTSKDMLDKIYLELNSNKLS